MKSLVDIVIPVHNNFEITANCIESILHANTERIGKIIVVDDYSDEGLLNEFVLNQLDQLINSSKIEFLFVKPSKRSYYSGAMNYGFKFVNSKYVLLMSNDTKVCDKNFINTLIREFESLDNVAIISPFVFSDPNYSYSLNREKNILNRQIGGACWLLETEYFSKMNGFLQEGKYVHWHSDYEFCERVLDQKKKIVISSTSLYHMGGKSSKYVESHVYRG